MTVKIQIKDTIIDFPVSGESPNWAPEVVRAIQELANAVNSISSSYDISPQYLIIDQYSSANNVEIENLKFSSTNILSAQIFYAVKRQTEDEPLNPGEYVSEEGVLEIIYNQDNPIGNKWEMARTFVGNAKISFDISDLGQITFSTTALSGGINHTGIISFRALSILNS